MTKKLLLLMLLLSKLSGWGQTTDYPQNYFQKPMNIPLILAGTFGELRPNHFHSGVDIKTQQKEGFDVLSTAEGYVSRIKISHWGYGKAIYITHPNGYTTVYGHLQKFNPKIEAYLKKKQYEKKSFSIQLYPKSNELKISKGEVIAYSGSTGGFVGAHLHYEIRKTAGAVPVNPLLFGLKIADARKPKVNALYAYPLSFDAQVHQSGNPVNINLTPQKNGILRADTIVASGTIGFGVNAFDQLDGAKNHNGLYALDLLVNGRKIYHHDVEKFTFDESKYINLLIDYERFAKDKNRVQRCFILPNNKLSIYDRQFPELGYIEVVDGQFYDVKIIASDFAGNQSVVSIPLIGKKAPITLPKEEKLTEYPIIASAFNKFTKGGVTVAFPKNTFYEDFYLNFTPNDDGSVQVHTPTVPLHNSYTLTFDVRQFSQEDRKHLFIATFNKGGYPVYSSTVKKTNTFYTKTKKLGKFSLLSDFKSPSISPFNFKDKQWVSKLNYLKVKIKDELSGISTYKASIDGKWILMEWDLKKGLLVYDFNDLKLTGSQHILKVSVTDNAHNTKTYSATFYRKM